jgi:hypothetical protein
MDIIETVWLYADNDNPEGTQKTTYTVDGLLPGTSVLATIALSYFSEGVSVQDGTVGVAGALVRGWDVFNPDGSVQTIENTDFSGNSEFIDNCASVTFELTVTFARAYAQANVFQL